MNILKLQKKNWTKKLVVAMAVLLALSFMITAPSVYAEEEDTSTPSTSGDSSKESEIRDSLSSVNSELDTAKSEYQQAVDELKALEAEIQTLEAQIASKEAEIAETQAQIDAYQQQILELTEQIVVLEQEILDQNSALNQRLRVMYETGDQSVISVLLESESFLDFLSNMEMVRRIHESDKEFLEELERKLDEIEAKKAELQRIEEMLLNQRAALQTQKDQLDADQAALGEARARVQAIRDLALEDIERLEQESNRLKSELANLTSTWGDYGGGAMAWPCIGTITSEYGMRVNPVHGRYILHAGIDIGVSTGTPIHAAADGVVYFSGWNSGGYGYLVILDNGSGITTLYAHNSSLAVSVGQVVSRGDVIAYAGSTGNSTGPHCHFEVRVNGSPQNPRGWL